MAANTAGKGGKASVSLRWFQAVLFLLAVPPPVGHAGTPSPLEFGLSLLAGHTGDFLFLLPDVLRLLAALVIGFLVCGKLSAGRNAHANKLRRIIRGSSWCCCLWLAPA